MPPFHIIIPARYGSTRLPAKALLDIHGKPMLEHVYDRACESGASSVTIATDDERIVEAAKHFTDAVCMTAIQHQSGTDRVAEVARQLDMNAESIIVNLQGDEPLMPPTLITQVANALAERPDASIATACHRISDNADIFDPNVVKVVRDKDDYALYFSRAPLPWSRDGFYLDDLGHWQCRDPYVHYYRHIGLYAYRNTVLQQFSDSKPCSLEQSESLEQLRVLYQGGRIHVSEAQSAPESGVDTPLDLERVRLLLRS